MSSSARSSAARRFLPARKKIVGASLHRAAEDICPYVIRGSCSVSAGNPAPVGIEQLSRFEDNRGTGFHSLGFTVWGRAVLCRYVFGVWLAVAGCLTAAWAKDMALVSNKSNGVTEVSMAELVKICKGQTSRWPKGKPITFFSLNPAATEMKLVLEKVYGMSSDEVSALISSANHGRANHPAIVVVNSDKALVRGGGIHARRRGSGGRVLDHRRHYRLAH